MIRVAEDCRTELVGLVVTAAASASTREGDHVVRADGCVRRIRTGPSAETAEMDPGAISNAMLSTRCFFAKVAKRSVFVAGMEYFPCREPRPIDRESS